MWGVRWRRVGSGCCLEAKLCALGGGTERCKCGVSLWLACCLQDSMKLRDYDQRDETTRCSGHAEPETE